MTVRMRVVIGESEADPERLEELTTALRDELLDLDLDDVTREHDETPPADARGIDLALAGVLLILLKQSVDVAAQVLRRSAPGRDAVQRNAPFRLRSATDRSN